MEIRSVHVRITGRVQGVGYRAFVARRAEAQGMTGWVRNRRDGSVEAVLCGSPRDVDVLIDDCRKGPDWARVEAVNIVSKAAPVSSGFQVLPTE